MTPVFIYALNDPATGIVRYCGQTIDPDVRLAKHLRNSRKEKWHVANWIKSLLSKNLRPVMEILDVVPNNEADFWECEYIQNFRERGFDLTNGTEGGDGCGSGDKHPGFGKKRSPETCAKISVANSGEKNGMFGKKLSSEAIAHRTALQKGKKHSPEFCAAQSARFKGKKLSPEHCYKLSLAHVGNKPSLETRAKMSATHQARLRRLREVLV